MFALARHRAGDMGEAERIYRRVLDIDPDQPDALHLLGLITLDRDTAEAVALLTRAAEAAPTVAAIQNALGTAQRAAGALNAAIASYTNATRLDERPEFLTNLAAALLEAGDLAAAEAAAMRASDLAPQFLDAAFVLGNVSRARGEHTLAERWYTRATASDHLKRPALLNLGNTRRALGRLDEAIATYQELLALGASEMDATARFALGTTLRDAGRDTDAMECLRALVLHCPTHRDGWFHLGVLVHQSGAAPVAIEAYTRAERCGLDTAALHTNLGLALSQLGRLGEAVDHQRRAVALEATAADLRINLATTLHQAGALNEAAAACNAAIAIDPHRAASHSVLGAVRMQQGRRDAAFAAHARALTLDPRSATVLNEYAHALIDDNDVPGALELYRRALDAAPDMPELHFHRALALLSAGDLLAGWDEYAWRWRLPKMSLQWRIPRPLWQGEPLDGRTLLVWREQGIGDELMFASCLPDLAEAGGRLIIACAPKLRSLFARSFPRATLIDERALAAPAALAADVHAPIGDLPRWLRPTVGDFPQRRGFLSADPDRVAVWKQRLAALGPGPAIGICWRSGLLTPSRRAGYAALSEWAPVLRVPGVKFVSLQYDDCGPEIAAAAHELGVTVHQPDIDLLNDMDEAAALTAALDRVISAPTAVSELAGALGVPTWRVTAGRDWTMLGTPGRPWFPTMQMFSRAPGESWRNVFTRVAAGLATHPENGS